LRKYSWEDIYQSLGLNWEVIRQVTIHGQPVASIRLSQKYRALVIRQDNILRVLSLHLDHDSAYA
jgi:hypothetical protein